MFSAYKIPKYRSFFGDAIEKRRQTNHLSGNQLSSALSAGVEAASADDEFVQRQVEAGGQTGWEGERLGLAVAGQTATNGTGPRTDACAHLAHLGDQTRQATGTQLALLTVLRIDAVERLKRRWSGVSIARQA